MRFTCKKDFYDLDLRSQYVKGLSYTVKAGSRYDKLRAKMPEWLASGKVESGGSVAEVSGGSQVKPLTIVERIKSWL